MHSIIQREHFFLYIIQQRLSFITNETFYQLYFLPLFCRVDFFCMHHMLTSVYGFIIKLCILDVIKRNYVENWRTLTHISSFVCGCCFHEGMVHNNSRAYKNVKKFHYDTVLLLEKKHLLSFFAGNISGISIQYHVLPLSL